MLSHWSKCELWFENLWLIDSTLNHYIGANHSQTLKHVTHLICNVIYNSWNNTAVAMMNRIKIYFLQNWNPMSIIWLSSKRKKKMFGYKHARYVFSYSWIKKRKWQKHLKSNSVAANFLGPTIIGFLCSFSFTNNSILTNSVMHTDQPQAHGVSPVLWA